MMTKYPSPQDMVRYLGEDVMIEWIEPKSDWPSFRVIEVDTEEENVVLRAIDTPEGRKPDGCQIVCYVDEILTIHNL